MDHAAALSTWYAAIKAGDADALAGVTTDDVEVVWNGDPELIPWAGRHRGRHEVLAFFRTIATHLEVVEIRTQDTFVADGGVVVLAEGRWRVRRNDAAVTARMANVFRFVDDRIAAFMVYNDTAAFLLALGR